MPVANVKANATYRYFNTGHWAVEPAFTGVTDAHGIGFGAIAAAQRGYGFDEPRLCAAAKALPLTPSGLPREGVYLGKDDGLGGLNGAQCLVGARATIRVHASIGRNDAPVSGQLALWTGKKKLRPVAFVDWTPKRVTVYLSDDCRS